MSAPALDRVTRALVAWVAAVERMKWTVIAVFTVLTGVFLSYTANHLTVNTDTSRMIDPDLPFRQVYEDYKRLFPQLVDNLLVVVDSDVPEIAEQTTAALAGRMAANEHLFSDVFAPVAEPFFRRNGLMFLDTDELADVIDRLAEVQPLLAKLSQDPSLRGLFEVLTDAVDDVIDSGNVPAGMADAFDSIEAVVRARTAGEPRFLSWQSLLDPDSEDIGKTRYFIAARPSLDFSSLQPARAALGEIRSLADDLAASVDGPVTIRITGQAALNTEELSSVSKGATRAGIISFVLVALLLGFGLRSAKLVLVTLLTLVAGLVWTATFAAVAIGYLNMISVAFAVLFIGLGVDFGIHVCLRYREELARTGDRHQALANMAGGVGVALALCAPTTALAFFAFVPTAYVGLAQLGLISGVGMFIALLLSLTLLPALLAVLVPSPPNGAGARVLRSPEATIRRHGKSISLIALALGLAALPVVGGARFDFDPMKLRDPGTESVRTILTLFEDPDTAPYTLQVLAPDVESADRMVARLEALDEVDRAVTLSRFVPEDQDEKLDRIDEAAMFLLPLLENGVTAPPPDAAARAQALDDFRAKLGELEQTRVEPEFAASAARLLAAIEAFEARAGDRPALRAELERALIRFLPYQLDKLRELLSADEITLDDLPAHLRQRYQAADGTLRIEVFPSEDLRDQQALRRFVRAVQTVAPDATGPTAQIVESGDAVVAAIKKATLLAAIFILALLSVVLRNLRDILLVLVPLLLAGLYTVAATVVLDVPFNFANVIVLPLLIGLGVDGGIHLVLRAREETGKAALLETSTPMAVLLSALTTIGSFGSLAVSSHRGTASMGELLTIAISITLLCTLVVLPAMMAWAEHRAKARKTSPNRD